MVKGNESDWLLFNPLTAFTDLKQMPLVRFVFKFIVDGDCFHAKLIFYSETILEMKSNKLVMHD